MKVRNILLGAAFVASAGFALLSGTASHVSAEACVTGAKYTDFDGSYSGRDTMTVWTKGHKMLCNDVKVNFTTFNVLNKNYNGQPFKNNPTALPQQSSFNKTVTLKKGTDGKTTVKVQIPNECTPYQMDAYIGPVQTKITTSEGLVGTNAIVGKIFQKTKDNCNVEKDIKVCDLATKTVVTIKESAFDSTKYSKNLVDCKEEKHMCTVPGKENLPVNSPDCKEEKCDVPGKEDLPKNSADCVEEEEELPQTGAGSIAAGFLSLGSLAGSAVAYIRSRRG